MGGSFDTSDLCRCDRGCHESSTKSQAEEGWRRLDTVVGRSLRLKQGLQLSVAGESPAEGQEGGGEVEGPGGGGGGEGVGEEEGGEKILN